MNFVGNKVDDNFEKIEGGRWFSWYLCLAEYGRVLVENETGIIVKEYDDNAGKQLIRFDIKRFDQLQSDLGPFWLMMNGELETEHDEFRTAIIEKAKLIREGVEKDWDLPEIEIFLKVKGL